MEEFIDKNLICYFSWGRREYVEKTFPLLLSSIRQQDRLLVLDQEGHNLEYYSQFMDKIDFLIVPKQNYFIGGAWTLFKYISKFLLEIKKMDDEPESEHKYTFWYPNYINILESDALIRRNDWIDILMNCFKENIPIVTGFKNEDDPNEKIIKVEGRVYFKESAHGVNVICRVSDFLEVINFPAFMQDGYFSKQLRPKGRIACIPCIDHIGTKRRKAGFFK